MASILIVDDDGAAAEIHASLLRMFGYETAFVTSGEATLEYLRSTLPHLVILDMMMPDINGLDLLRKIKADKRTSGLPVVLFSALDEAEWRERAAIAGAHDYWIKGGFDFGELEEKVASCMAALVCTSPSTPKGGAPQCPVTSESGNKIASTMSEYPNLKKIIAEYVETLPAEVFKLRNLLSRGDMQSLRRVVHRLHGNAGGYGFDPISVLAGNVEDAIKDMDHPESIALKVNGLIDLIRCVEGFDEDSAMAPGQLSQAVA